MATKKPLVLDNAGRIQQLQAGDSISGAPATTPGGSSGQVQYNNGGSFGGFTVGGEGSLDTSTGTLLVDRQSYGPTSVSGSITIDRNNGECQRLSITGNVTSTTISNFGTAGKLRKLVLEIWNTGAFTFTWPVGTIWPGGLPLEVTQGAGKKDVVVLMTMDGGTTVYGTVVGSNYI